eukprot:scaffold7359_cov255-Pinguiococcus_pyrenoidosus.AAC.28
MVSRTSWRGTSALKKPRIFSCVSGPENVLRTLEIRVSSAWSSSLSSSSSKAAAKVMCRVAEAVQDAFVLRVGRCRGRNSRSLGNVPFPGRQPIRERYPSASVANFNLGPILRSPTGMRPP